MVDWSAEYLRKEFRISTAFRMDRRLKISILYMKELPLIL